MEDFFEFVITIIFKIIVQFIFWALLTPVFFFFATPVILLIALFREGDYQDNIRQYHIKAFSFWKECIMFLPDFLE
ncbi:MAG: hypothetical protein GY755_11645 [Chloroflexi bacterium]|nr:hypothetical protein [Chloroflexota bacterium]